MTRLRASASPGLLSGEVRGNAFSWFLLRELKFPARRVQELALVLASEQKLPVADSRAVLRKLTLPARCCSADSSRRLAVAENLRFSVCFSARCGSTHLISPPPKPPRPPKSAEGAGNCAIASVQKHGTCETFSPPSRFCPGQTRIRICWTGLRCLPDRKHLLQ